jgi:DNA-binding transcriptional MerR regulator
MLTTSEVEYFEYLASRLTSKQASALLGISPKTLATWRGEGFGPQYSRIRGRIYYFKQDVYAWIKQQGTFTSTAEYSEL